MVVSVDRHHHRSDRRDPRRDSFAADRSIATDVVQAANDKEQIATMLEQGLDKVKGEWKLVTKA